MTLRQKEYLSIGLVLTGGVFGMLASKNNWGTAAVWAALVMLFAGLALRLVWHRCPDCGSYLGRHWAKFCPSCGKEIDFGAKK